MALCLLLMARSANADITDPGFVESPFAKLKTTITSMAWAPDASGRLFVTRQNGVVEIVENGTVLATPFATLSPVHAIAECGLLGLAFDPGFNQNGYVYVFATVTAVEQQIIRYRAVGNTATEKTVIISGLPAKDTYHCGGGLGFGGDGKLYWSTGDLGIYLGVDDDLASLGAKIGRANVDGSAPPDNPYFDGVGPNNDHIWASGLRSPFSLTFEPSSERLWVNVAGTKYEQVFRPTAGSNAGWDDYENNQPVGFLAPTIAYRTGQAEVRALANSNRSAGAAVFSTNVPHGFRLGTKVSVSGVSDPSFNTSGYVSDVPSTTEFSIEQAGPNAASSGGSATTLDIGRAITGGAFWDSSAVPVEYRGDFFFGDFVSGNLVRAKLGAAGTPVSVDLWGSYKLPTDMAVGPDGDLYYASYGSAADGGPIAKASYVFKSQTLVVSPLHLRTPETVPGFVHVRLALAPTAPVTVQVARASGDPDVQLTQSSSLSFDSGNWMKPKSVAVLGAQDADAVDDSAVVRVSAQGLTAQDVVVRITDPDAPRLRVTPPALSLVEGESGTLLVSLTGEPLHAVTVTTQRTGGDGDVAVESGAQFVLNASNWDKPQSVKIGAAEDSDSVDDTATVTVGDGAGDSVEVQVAVSDDDKNSGDAGVDAAAGGAPASDSPEDGGCGCNLGRSQRVPSALILVVLLPLGLRRRRQLNERAGP